MGCQSSAQSRLIFMTTPHVVGYAETSRLGETLFQFGKGALAGSGCSLPAYCFGLRYYAPIALRYQRPELAGFRTRVLALKTLS